MNNVKTSLEAQNQPSCLGAVMPSIYSMKLHEVIALTPTSIQGTAVSYYSVMRVAGGWIYQVWDTEKQEYVRETFVPFNMETLETNIKNGIVHQTPREFFEAKFGKIENDSDRLCIAMIAEYTEYINNLNK